jgi:hypothetical protein
VPGPTGGVLLRPHPPGTQAVDAATVRVRYPQGGTGGGSAVGGSTTPIATSDAVRLSYTVRFEPGFPFVKGGKLPGICGGTCPTGGMPADGANGFSMRYMWRSGGAGQVYLYIPRSGTYGVELGTGSWTFVPGRQHRLVCDIRLNTPGRSDGSVTVWFDRDTSGAPTFVARNLLFRTTSALKADKFLFSTFYGGHTSDWAPPRTTFADFSDFRVQKLA